MVDVGAVITDQIGYYLASVVTGEALAALGSNQTATGPRLGQLDPVEVAEGGRMWRAAGCGRVRTGVQIVWASKIHEKKKKASVGQGKTSGTVSTYAYSADLVFAIGQAFAGTDGKGAIEKLWALKFNGKTVYNAKKPKNGKHRYASLAIRLGTDSQVVLGVLEQAKGVGNVPRFNNTACVGINELKLEDFGNGIPQVIDAIWQPDEYPYTVGDFIRHVWARVPGRNTNEIDVTRVTGKNTITLDGNGNYPLQGITFRGPVSPLEILRTVMLAFDLGVQETNGVVTFFDRGTETIVEIPADMLGASTGDPQVRDLPLNIEDSPDNALPSEVVVNYIDEDQAWKRSSVRQKVNNAPAGENIVEIDLPITLKREEARRIVRRKVWEPYQTRNPVTMPLPPDFIDVQEGDIPAVPFKGQTVYVYVQKKTVGANWVVEIEGVVIDTRAGADEILSDASGSWKGDLEDTLDSLDPTDGDDDSDYSPPVLATKMANLPGITDEETYGVVGFWLAHAAQDSDALWIGASLFVATKTNGKYKQVLSKTINKETTIGFALTALPDSTAKAGFWDRINHVDVQMFEGVMESVDAEEVESGKNWLAIGQGEAFEIIAFRDAIVVDALTINGLTDIVITAPDTLSSASSDFVALDVKVGRYLKITGLSEEDNADRLLKVVSVTTTDIVFDVVGIDILPLVNETQDPSQPVTLSQGSTYRLSMLRRGMRDTKDHCATHAIGDTVMVFESSDLVYIQHAAGEVGKKRWFKDVPLGLEIDDVAEIQFTSLAETLRCFAPCHLVGVRGISMDVPGGFEDTGIPASDTIHLGWLHRSRLTHLAPTDLDLHDLCPNERWGKHGDRMQWRISVYNAATMLPADLVRVATITPGFDHDPPQTPVDPTKYRLIEWKYTTGMQTTDGTLGNQVWFKIQQVAKPPTTLGNPAYITVE